MSDLKDDVRDLVAYANKADAEIADMERELEALKARVIRARDRADIAHRRGGGHCCEYRAALQSVAAILETGKTEASDPHPFAAASGDGEVRSVDRGVPGEHQGWYGTLSPDESTMDGINTEDDK